MARRPEIGNIQLYPDRPLKDSDKNGYVLKFYCPIQQKRIRRNCGTRDKREARRILRECRERLLNGEYAESGGAITIDHQRAKVRARIALVTSADASAPSWHDCYDQYYNFKKPRCRQKSLRDLASRIEMTGRILEAYMLEYAQDRLLDGDEGLYDYRAPMTVNSVVSDVMTFLRYCQRHEWIGDVPALEKLPVDEVMKGRPITVAEFDKMMEATPKVVGRNASESWQTVLQVLWESAFRVGDVMDFSWDNQRHIHPIWPTHGFNHPTLMIPSSQKNKKAQEIPMLPGLRAQLEQVPDSQRTGWVVNPRPVDYQKRMKRDWFKPTARDLAKLAAEYSNTAIAKACGVTEACIRKWLKQMDGGVQPPRPASSSDITGKIVAEVRGRAEAAIKSRNADNGRRLTKEHVGRVISQIGELAGIVVQEPDEGEGRRIKYASAHDLRRGCALRLINAGVSAETLKVVLRHKDFKTTELFYGAIRAAQSAASELHEKLAAADKKSALVGGLVGGQEKTPQLSAAELAKLKALLNAL